MQNIIRQEVKVSDVLKSGIKVDVHSVTKEKIQGVIKRSGAELKQHKAEKKREE